MRRWTWAWVWSIVLKEVGIELGWYLALEPMVMEIILDEQRQVVLDRPLADIHSILQRLTSHFLNDFFKMRNPNL